MIKFISVRHRIGSDRSDRTQGGVLAREVGLGKIEIGERTIQGLAEVVFPHAQNMSAFQKGKPIA